jgi:two-component system, OmpR family, phosphate regulon response regulator PhoB
MKIILVVEDSENLVRFVRVNLELEGFTVLATASGRQAMEMATESRPDLVILDLMLPQMGGWELLARLKSHPELYRIPILILTAAADPEEEVRARRMGATDYIVKPVSANELVRRVKRVLSESTPD